MFIFRLCNCPCRCTTYVAAKLATHAVNLEYDLVAGRRGHRDLLTEAMLMRLTGADAAAVVNNNAAAVLLALHALAAGREVIVSRGELVEIGGSFRIPDVMRAAGVVLREVGTTNRTHLSDYADAISDETALLLKVHPSNYRVEGFTSEVGLSELVGLGRERGLSVMEDLGSGALIDLSAWGVTGEPLVRERVEAGTDIVTFSGDKLLGGPQAGIIVGAKALVEVVRRDPLMRAVRVDKLTYAALAATLDIYERSAHPERELPMLRAMSRSVDDLEGLAARCVEKWDGWLDGQASVEVRPSEAQVGSGAQPTARLESVAIVFVPVGASAVDIAASLRAADVPVIARIEDGCVWMDMRAMHDDDLAALDAAVSHVVRHFARLGASG